jgi:hypothetical protein
MDWLCAVCHETDLAKNGTNESTKYNYNNTVIQMRKVWTFTTTLHRTHTYVTVQCEQTNRDAQMYMCRSNKLSENTIHY